MAAARPPTAHPPKDKHAWCGHDCAVTEQQLLTQLFDHRKRDDVGDRPMIRPGLKPDPDWHKKAIFYELHVRAFFDSDNDGCGDFRGLAERLPYLHFVGVDCIWLLPFFPSPLRDDGYDVADFNTIAEKFGSLEDFKFLIDEAHSWGIRVLVEFVMNHTSDQHSWFKESRSSRDNPKRDWYIWSDTAEKYSGVRIFVDTEDSNWALDQGTGQYYYHRFFSHQPDLNYDNPEVQAAVIDVLRYWIDLGADGFRCDAVPYLFKREGTNCENLPETHAFFKKVRKIIDTEYPDRHIVLLAEANQWPDDVVPYFGDGDGNEFHMAFHFPLMPRMFMAVSQELRTPITEILRRTPDIPLNSQWTIFIRNHDELTLEMVTDEERDYMYAQYAEDPVMRCNLGIRRRLAPLLENNIPAIKLLFSLMWTLPGTPCMYYGDEILIGDNVFLGDRNGVRTPMQWSSDRNGGFSKADPQRLFLPIVSDSIYGYQATNVESQLKNKSSFLRWVHRMIRIRRKHPSMALGRLRFISLLYNNVMCFTRIYEQDVYLILCSFSKNPASAEVDLGEWADWTPVELTNDTVFVKVPPKGQMYHVTFPPYGFFWFRLVPPTEAPARPSAPFDAGKVGPLTGAPSMVD